MASGRVGGTKAKVSGKVGNEVYQIVKNPDGTYSQIVRAKGTTTVNRTTPKLQAQRMCTGMVESMMKQLSPVAKISMQSAANKSKSLNAFSSFNLQRVMADCKANWYKDNRFPYPRFSNSKNYAVDLGGPWLISSGSLQFNLFDKVLNRYIDLSHWPDFNPRVNESLVLTWSVKGRYNTVGDFFKAYRITRLDTIVMCGFYYRMYNIDEESGDADEEHKHVYLILKPNPRISDNTPFTPQVIDHLFSVQTNKNIIWGWKDDKKIFGVGWAVNNFVDISIWGYAAAFSISYLDGKKKISYSQYKNLAYGSETWLSGAQPTRVFGSWIGEPQNQNYPSPYI